MKNVQVYEEGLKRHIGLILLLCLSLPLQSQNLVPNPSFEDFVDFTAKSGSGWHKIQITDTPDYFNLDGQIL